MKLARLGCANNLKLFFDRQINDNYGKGVI